MEVKNQPSTPHIHLSMASTLPPTSNTKTKASEQRVWHYIGIDKWGIINQSLKISENELLTMWSDQPPPPPPRHSLTPPTTFLPLFSTCLTWHTFLLMAHTRCDTCSPVQAAVVAWGRGRRQETHGDTKHFQTTRVTPAATRFLRAGCYRVTWQAPNSRTQRLVRICF